MTLYSATSDGITGSFREVARYSDVLEPPSEPRRADSWRTGGIVHAWGGGAPRVVVLGSSHALMYGKVIDDACRRMRLSVAFLSANGISPWFGNNDEDAFSKEFDEARRRYLRTWKPDVVLVVDRWDVSEVGEFTRNIRKLADELQVSGRRVVLLSQVPVLRVGQNVNLREFVSRRFGRDGTKPRIPQDDDAPRRKEILSEMETLVLKRPGLELLRVDGPFTLPDGTVKYSEGRKFLYADDDHLSQAGAALVQDRIAAAIARDCATTAPDPRDQAHGLTGRVARLSSAR